MSRRAGTIPDSATGTTGGVASDVPSTRVENDPIAMGFIIGLLVGEGHFGGDGKQAHVILRMHARHEATFRWLVETVPGSRLYGPYDHGGRHYYQWMCRGRSLWDNLVPLLNRNLALLDDHVAGRFRAMLERYAALTAGALSQPVRGAADDLT